MSFPSFIFPKVLLFIAGAAPGAAAPSVLIIDITNTTEDSRCLALIADLPGLCWRNALLDCVMTGVGSPYSITTSNRPLSPGDARSPAPRSYLLAPLHFPDST